MKSMTYASIIICSLILQIACFSKANAQTKIDVLSENYKVRIVCTETDKSINRKTDLRNFNRVISCFGAADSSKVQDITALGGDVRLLHYADNYFFVPETKFAHDGFEINDTHFYITINNSLKIKVGEKITPLLKTTIAKLQRRNVKMLGTEENINASNIGLISLPYGYTKNGKTQEALHWLNIYYDMNSQRIIRIYDYHAS